MIHCSAVDSVSWLAPNISPIVGDTLSLPGGLPCSWSSLWSSAMMKASVISRMVLDSMLCRCSTTLFTMNLLNSRLRSLKFSKMVLMGFGKYCSQGMTSTILPAPTVSVNWSFRPTTWVNSSSS
ncbi:hypothetical protein DPEC_G00041440 [Dallia pectoralis]|uniref:Uncharacterized protein n=1 Tax=Dallia pectoralis TaxID=75939 RepID=A0ACC2HF95_DALPE|nr:hypothetical protein DPEC_G00041440 [Dallia pectoralis]